MAKRLAVEILLTLAAGFVLGLFGPFGTYEMPTGLRLAYWMVFGLVGYAIFRPLIIVGAWLAEALSISAMIGVSLAMLIAAAPMTLMVALLFSDFNLTVALSWDGIGLLYFQVWLVGFLTNTMFMLLFREDAIPQRVLPVESSPDARIDEQSSQSPFYARLPAGFGPVIALRGEDHYVRAISMSRDVLILIRLRDAIAELGSAEGLQVHRSWWVAPEGVAQVRRNGRQTNIMLANGTEVPVARDALSRLKAAGWFDLKAKEDTDV